MKTHLLFWVAPILALFALGCGDDNDEISLKEAEAQLLDAMCSHATDCHRFESVGDCKASTHLDFEALEPYIQNGSVEFHSEKLNACIDYHKKGLPCSFTESAQLKIDPDICGLFSGKVPEGGSCHWAHQCVSGLCGAPGSDCYSQCCDSTCQPKPPPGTPPAKVGEECAKNAVRSCEEGAFCLQDTSVSPFPICIAFLAPGAECTSASTDQCASPTWCEIDASTMKGICAWPSKHGEACDPAAFSLCDAEDDYCDPATKLCTAMKLPGEACGESVSCVDYARCLNGQCVKLSPKGGSCIEGEWTCMGDLECLAGSCGFEPTPICN